MSQVIRAHESKDRWATLQKGWKICNANVCESIYHNAALSSCLMLCYHQTFSFLHKLGVFLLIMICIFSIFPWHRSFEIRKNIWKIQILQNFLKDASAPLKNYATQVIEIFDPFPLITLRHLLSCIPPPCDTLKSDKLRAESDFSCKFWNFFCWNLCLFHTKCIK